MTELPGLERVRDRIWALPLGMPGSAIPWSAAYLIQDDDGRVHVIDPGTDTDENWARLSDAIARLGGDVASVTCTHLHPDHLGAAARLRQASHAPVALLDREVRALAAPAQPDPIGDWGVPADRLPELQVESPTIEIVPDVALRAGDILDIPGHRFEVLATPGHTIGHLCLVDATAGVILTGDHVLPTILPGIGLGGASPSNPVGDYLDSLDLVAAYDSCEVLPGHGFAFRGLAARCAEISEHHLRRSREVAAVLAATPDATTWQVAEQLTWSAGWANIAGFHLLSGLRQVDLHVGFVASDRSKLRLDKNP